MSPEILERVTPHARPGLLKMNATAPLSQPGAIQTVLERYSRGESMRQIADSLAINPSAIYHFLLRNFPEEWSQFQASLSLVERDDAKRELRAATDGVSVSRARELGRMSEWELERTCRSIYGDKLQVEQAGQAPIFHITVVHAPQIAPHNAVDAVIVDNSDSK